METSAEIAIENNQLIIRMMEIALYGFLALIAGTCIGFSILFWKNQDISDVYKLFDSFELAKLLAIVLIVLAVTVLAIKGIVQGDAVVAILSGIAGYVLGGFHRDRRPAAKPAPEAE